MRILYLSRTYSVHDRRFLEAITDGGHEALFLPLEHPKAGWEKRALPRGARLLSWPGATRDAEALWRVADRVKPDVVHAGPVPTAAYLAARAGLKPLLTMSWGSDMLVDAAKTRDSRARTKLALSRSDAFACDCRAVLREARRFAKIPTRKVVLFPWGIDLKKFRPGADVLRLRRRWEGDPLVVLSTRQWEPLYGTDVLVEGFARARKKDPRLKLILLGKGSLSRKIDAIIRRHRVEADVLRPGVIGHDRLPDYFRSADLYVGAAYSDGTSVSLLEAMATGAVPVVPGIPSNREWVAASRGGLFKAGEPGSLARALLRLTAARRRWPAMARANRAICEKRADWPKNARLLRGAYARLARAKR